MSGRTCSTAWTACSGLAQVVLTGCQGIPKSLANDVLKVRVHAGMRAQPAAKEKPRLTTKSLRDGMADDGKSGGAERVLRGLNRPSIHERKPPRTIVLGEPDHGEQEGSA